MRFIPPAGDDLQRESAGVFLFIFTERRYGSMLSAAREKAQGLIEYALILALVSIFVVVLLMLVGPQIGNLFSTINSSLTAF